MYEINCVDHQFFMITKPQDKNSLNLPVASGHSCLGLQIYFFYHEKAERIHYGDGRGLGGTQIKWAVYILTLLINIMLMVFHHLFLF